ncbi:MAG TPA: geranylgeranylglycerol-phosphate geranylgeranyltransferase [Candidatus Thermoplasmatota archaeon]|nr:geranylgeranylglycerol-phosphate geranylgeranyltransferase [Candidatus Thermoplasmatota archaeon]
MQAQIRAQSPPAVARAAALWQLLRPGNCAMTAVGVVAGALVASGPAAASLWPTVALGAAAGFAFAGAGNALNDWVDREVDARAHPGRPLPSGRLSPDAALRAQAVLFALSVAAAAAIAWTFTSPLALLLVLPALVLMVAYELRLKATGLSGNVAVSLLTGAPFVMGGIAVNAPETPVLVLALLAVLVNLGREVVKDVEDMQADAGARRTFPMTAGVSAATALARAAILAGVALSPLPWLLGTMGPSYLPAVAAADVVLLWAAFEAKRPSRSSRLAKLGMLVGLVAFLVGRMGA